MFSWKKKKKKLFENNWNSFFKPVCICLFLHLFFNINWIRVKLVKHAICLFLNNNSNKRKERGHWVQNSLNCTYDRQTQMQLFFCFSTNLPDCALNCVIDFCNVSKFMYVIRTYCRMILTEEVNVEFIFTLKEY